MNLYTSRTVLRPFTQKDLQDLHEIMNNESIASLAGFKRKDTLSETNTTLVHFLKESSNNLWAIEFLSTHKMIGWIELHSPIDSLCIHAKEIGFVLSKSHWGQAIMVEVISSITNYAFEKLHIPNIICSHFKDNLQSQKVILKSNFKPFLRDETKLFYILHNTAFQ